MKYIGGCLLHKGTFKLYLTLQLGSHAKFFSCRKVKHFRRNTQVYLNKIKAHFNYFLNLLISHTTAKQSTPSHVPIAKPP